MVQGAKGMTLVAPPSSRTLELRPYQTDAIEALAQGKLAGHIRQVLCAPTGSGKCLGPSTGVMMYDGRVKVVEDIRHGDLLMGGDGKPTAVLSTTKGQGPLYRISPVKGPAWVCNDEHILVLQRTGEPDNPKTRKRNRSGEVVEVSLKNWLTWSDYKKHVHKLFRVGVDFPSRPLPIHPYLLGVLLGDGSLTRNRVMLASVDQEVVRAVSWLALQHGVVCKATPVEGRTPAYLLSNERGKGNPLLEMLRGLGLAEKRSGAKFIPHEYQAAGRAQRLELLAGLLDTDGHLGGGMYDFLSKSKALADGVAFVARSLGLAAYVAVKKSKYKGEMRKYWRVAITGEVSEIPCRIPRKQAQPRRQKKDVRRTGFSVEPLGEGEYHGFTLDRDGRFLLADFTVTHNTEMAFHLIQRANAKGSRVAFVCDRRVLVQQTSERLWDYGIEHGVAMSSDTFGRDARIQVCSAQTIEKREYWQDLDVLIIDECHTQRKAIVEFAKRWGGPVIGLTATPLTEGMGDIYSHVVNATTTDGLLDDGWLSPLKMFAAQEIDMTGAKKTAGEWQASEVRTRGRHIIGDIVSEWQKMTSLHFGGPVKTLGFSADIAHGKDICEAFQAAGYDFRQSTYRDSEEVSTQMVNAFKRGDFPGLISVEKYVKGFDVPDILCMIGARPYSSSLAAFLQQLGRGMRTAPGKEMCLYLDFAGNVAGWYQDVLEFWANGVDELPKEKKKKPKRKEGRERADILCVCGYVMPVGADECPSCGRVRERRTRISTVAGRLEEVTGKGSRNWAEDRRWTWRQMCRVGLERKGDPALARRLALAQFKNLYGTWPPHGWEFDPVEGESDRRVQRVVQRQLQAYFKRKDKETKRSTLPARATPERAPEDTGLYPPDDMVG